MTDPRWCIDTDLNTRFPVYTRFNANDVLPDPITPLGASMAWIPHMLPGSSMGYAALGAVTAEESIDFAAWPFGAFCYGHLYVNVTMARLVGIRSGIGWAGIDAAFFGSHPDAPPHLDSPSDINAEVSQRIADRTTWTLTATSFPDLEEETTLADGFREQRPDIARLTNGALVARARSMMPYQRVTWRGELIAGSQAAIGPAVVMSLLGDDPSVNVVDIIGPAGDIVSAAPSYALWEMSRLVRADADATALFDAGIEGLYDQLEGTHPALHERFTAFLREFGYRGPSEWDLGADSWETRPELALALLDRMRQLDDSASPAIRRAESAERAERAYAIVNARLDGNAEAQATLRMAVDSARRVASWRELGKANCIKLLNESRVAMLEVGRRLAAAGHIAHPRQIFMALDEELDLLVLEPGALTERLATRELEWKDLGNVVLPLFLQAGAPMTPLAELPRKSDAGIAVATSGDVLQGTPASSGVARGRARIILNPGEISAFEPGDVLVAPQTDPSWTPLFVVASAVIVGVGALSSHAMIVSRELGIPCVAGLEGAAERIPDGAMIEVDGSTGAVTLL
jgi:phosphohistidine swiveling domain-containing protein